MPLKDKEQELIYRRAWYKRNSEKLRAKAYSRKDKLRKWFKDYKSTLTCTRCGENHIACLEFHHPNGERVGAVRPGLLAGRGWSIERMSKELERCVVLCANCHRKEHYSSSV